jgi:hypothetical protein
VDQFLELLMSLNREKSTTEEKRYDG